MTTKTQPTTTRRTAIPYRILGIDGGSRWIGWGVLDAGEPTYWGTIDNRASVQDDRAIRRGVRTAIGRLLQDLKPEVVAVEEATNLSATRMRPFRIALEEIEQVIRKAGPKLVWISPKTARAIVTGDGWADKTTVARVLARTYPHLRRWLLPRKAKEMARYVHHSSDALCCAIAVATQRGSTHRNPRHAD